MVLEDLKDVHINQSIHLEDCLTQYDLYFSIALSDIFGYDIHNIYKDKKLLHSFCVDKFDEQHTYYIDARGIFDKEEKLLRKYEMDDNIKTEIKSYYDYIEDETLNYYIYHDILHFIFDNAEMYCDDSQFTDKTLDKKISQAEMNNELKKSNIVKLIYMNKNKVCTKIEADFFNKTIQAINFTDCNFEKAFGCRENPTWDDFMHFLEDRCVPRTRYNIMEYLEQLNIKEYDPYLITQKTRGRITDDKRWIHYEKESKNDSIR